ncbi:hypothetical protein C8J57DRAFT_1602967 [Mycena rebaudengoi]|nr:hypothetical protein C8J57DRAFT_1602967 [Mycena rebaudengoi]
MRAVAPRAACFCSAGIAAVGLQIGRAHRHPRPPVSRARDWRSMWACRYEERASSLCVGLAGAGLTLRAGSRLRGFVAAARAALRWGLRLALGCSRPSFPLPLIILTLISVDLLPRPCHLIFNELLCALAPDVSISFMMAIYEIFDASCPPFRERESVEGIMELGTTSDFTGNRMPDRAPTPFLAPELDAVLSRAPTPLPAWDTNDAVPSFSTCPSTPVYVPQHEFCPSPTWESSPTEFANVGKTTDALRRVTPAANSIPRPRKRRRLNNPTTPNVVLKYLDIEAHEDDMEDDEEVGEKDHGEPFVTSCASCKHLADFIDDGPAEDSPLPSSVDKVSDSDDSATLEEIAARFVAQSRKEMTSREMAEDAYDGTIGMLGRLPHANDPSVWAVRTKRGAEAALLEFLSAKAFEDITVLQISSVFVHKSRSGWVYVEAPTPRFFKTILSHKPHLLDSHTSPSVVPLHARVQLLSFNADFTPGQWARMTRGKFKDDLVYVCSYEQCLIVPRIPLKSAALPDGRVPPALFNSRLVSNAYPSEPLTKYNSATVFRGEVYRCGLLECDLKKGDLNGLDVRPTDEELSLFRDSGHPDLRGAYRDGFKDLALSEGDPVVFIESGQEGSIKLIEEQVVRRALFCPSEGKEADSFLVPVKQLRHQLLWNPPTLSFGERVRVVSGADHLGDWGTVEAIDDHHGVTIQPDGPLLAFMVPFECIEKYFKLGDFVQVFEGNLKGRIGWIVGFRGSGGIDVYPDPSTHELPSNMIASTEPVDNFVATLYVSRRDITLHLADISKTAPRKEASDLGLMKTAGRYEGREIFISNFHPLKGLRGHIVAWNQTVPKTRIRRDGAKTGKVEISQVGKKALENRNQHRFWEENNVPMDIVLTVKLQTRDRLEEIPGHQVYDMHTKLPLSQAQYVPFPGAPKVMKAAPAVPVPVLAESGGTTPRYPGPSSLNAWPETGDEYEEARREKQRFRELYFRDLTPSPPPRASTDLQTFALPPISVLPRPTSLPQPRSKTPPSNTKDQGLWLLDKRLKNKRLDIEIAGIQDSPHFSRLGKKAAKQDGAFGILVITANLKDADGLIEVKLDAVKFDPFRLPIRCIRPMRTTYRPPFVKDQVPLCKTDIRVVIIGADINGDDSSIGQYARTVQDDVHAFGPTVVKVVFPWLEGQVNSGYYDMEALCRSVNERIEWNHVPVDTTPFVRLM